MDFGRTSASSSVQTSFYIPSQHSFYLIFNNAIYMNAKHYKLISISLLLHKEITITRQHLVQKNLFHPHFHMFSFLFISFNFQCNIVQRINVCIISISHINPSSIFRSMRGRWAWVCWRLLALNILRGNFLFFCTVSIFSSLLKNEFHRSLIFLCFHCGIRHCGWFTAFLARFCRKMLRDWYHFCGIFLKQVEWQ